VTLWDFAVSRYARGDVAAACLALQDDHGQCAPLLLWRLWAIDRPVGSEVLAAAVGAARSWDAAVVAPLRAVRRRLRAPLAAVGDDMRLAVRETVQAAELTAERRLLDALEALTPVPDGREADPAAALAELTRAWGAAAPAEPLDRLAAAVLAATGGARAGGQVAMNDDIETDDDAAIRIALSDLRLAHQDLDAAVLALEASPRPDQLRIARLKKRKLMLRDRIAELEDRLTPDIIA
jgi:uncharacterized protein (TIGR02444 family)